MESKKTDIRITKTHIALRGAFFELAQDTPFDKITINDLCDKAMVRRATFYRHFEDKYDFFKYLIRYIIEGFNERNSEQYSTMNPEIFYTSVIQDILEYLKENKKLINSLMMSDYYPLLENIFFKQIYEIIFEQFKREKANGFIFYTNEATLAQFFTGGIISVIFNWQSSGQQQPISELTEDIHKMLMQFWRNIPKSNDKTY